MSVDVAVVGAGLLGSYCAWRLATAGASVVVLDQGAAGDGSTGRAAGGLRRQFSSSYEIELSTASLAFYEQLERDDDFAGGIDRVGYVFLAGDDQRGLLERSYDLQRDHGVDVEWLETDALRAAFPYCDPAGLSCGTRTADDGFIDPWSVHQWIWRRARAVGVVLRQHVPVHSAERDGAGWLVTSTAGIVHAAQVIIAAGAWTGSLAKGIGIDLPVMPSPRVKVLSDRHPELPAHMPLITDLVTGAYVRSEHGHALVGAKPAATPTGYDFDTSLERLAEVMGRAAARFPSLADAGIARAVYGLYEITPDGLPLAGPIAGHRGMHVIAGFNGHGIMHGPAVADALCAAITDDGDSPVDLGPTAPDRFAHGPTRRVVSLL